MAVTKNSSAFAEFVLEREEQLQTTIFPILEANHKQGIKTLVVKKELEGRKVQVTCIGIKIPAGSTESPDVEFIELKAGQTLDLSSYQVADIEPVSLKFSAPKKRI